MNYYNRNFESQKLSFTETSQKNFPTFFNDILNVYSMNGHFRCIYHNFSKRKKIKLFVLFLKPFFITRNIYKYLYDDIKMWIKIYISLKKYDKLLLIR